MRFVLLNQFYPPDVAPTGRYLHDLARALVGAGHQVTVFASRHAYEGGGDYARREALDGVEVMRLAGFAFGREGHLGKLADYAAYYARLAVELLRGARADVIVSLTTPPFLGLLAKLAADLTGARHAHWVMDVYPDVMEAHGMGGGPALAALRVLARHSFSGASAIITLGPAMADRVRKYAPAAAVDHVPLWRPVGLAPWPADEPVRLRGERGWEPERLVLLYSGNFGLGHRFDEFLRAAERLGPSGPRWVFAGRGRARAQVERFAAERPGLPVELLSYTPEDRLREHLCSADVHLISMDSAWEGTLLPSKLQASFAVGRPVIFVGNTSHDMARWISEAGAGWVVAEGDERGLLEAVAQASSAQERARRGAAAAAFAERHFDRECNLGAMIARYTAMPT